MWSNKGKELAEEAERKFQARFETDAQDGDGDAQGTEAQIAAQIKQWQDEADAPPPQPKEVSGRRHARNSGRGL